MRSDVHYEVLPPLQRAVWRSLRSGAKRLERWGFYLAGGTGLALHLGHRQSVDFDFFSRGAGTASQIHDWLRPLHGFVLREIDESTLHAEFGKVKVSFIAAYKYPLVGKIAIIQGIRLASVVDIALMKLISITHRATLRDYIDLAAVVRAGVALGRLLDLSRGKYGDNFNVMVPLRALVSFQDLEPEKPVLLDKGLERYWQKILQDAVRQVTREK